MGLLRPFVFAFYSDSFVGGERRGGPLPYYVPHSLLAFVMCPGRLTRLVAIQGRITKRNVLSSNSPHSVPSLAASMRT